MGNDLQGISPYAQQFDIRPDVATRVLIKDDWSESWQTVDAMANVHIRTDT